MLIENAAGIFSGLPGTGMRTIGAIRVRDGVIVEIGALQAEPDERRLDASGCVVYPGLISTPSSPVPERPEGRAVRYRPSARRLAALGAYRFWSKIDEEALAVAARIALTDLLLYGDDDGGRPSLSLQRHLQVRTRRRSSSKSRAASAFAWCSAAEARPGHGTSTPTNSCLCRLNRWTACCNRSKPVRNAFTIPRQTA